MTDQAPNHISDSGYLDSWVVPADQVQAMQIPTPPIVSISNTNGQPLVSIHPDGRTEFGDGYQPDEAALAFWDAVQRWAPTPMVQQYGRPLTERINAELAAGEVAQKKLERLDGMAAAWAERLPETIRRDTVVDAIHQVTRGEA
ncbi:hypothetical protein ACFYQT_40260 [Streptomyces tibetensis]|uniref:Uncharacterized protein n=1 Tax=Streptomyces tibetensis TaxID=2382123 RepID=A0ABW6NAJ3_9ACTN